MVMRRAGARLSVGYLAIVALRRLPRFIRTVPSRATRFPSRVYANDRVISVPPASSRLGSVGADDANFVVLNFSGPTTPESFWAS